MAVAMPTEAESTITRSVIQGGVERDRRVYRVRWAPDPPDRQAAIDFFAARGALYADGVPRAVLAMPYDEAVRHLGRHAFPQTFDLLGLSPGRGCGVPVTDDDLRRLEHLPELGALHLSSPAVTDAGVRHLRHLRALRRLVLYSPSVTDACVDDLAALTTLCTLDLQGSPGVSDGAFVALCRRLPALSEAWPTELFAASREGRSR
jgi:hypothetical protein